MKKLILFLLLITSYIQAENVFDVFNYEKLSSDPVTFIPEEAIYYNSIRLDIKSSFGKIFYLINSQFSKSEPVEYTKELYLKGESGRVMDYNILIMLEKDGGIIEFYSRTYRIDRIDKFNKKIVESKKKYTKNLIQNNDNIVINYSFPDKIYYTASLQREFIIPKEITENTNEIKTINQTKVNNEKSVFLNMVIYPENGKNKIDIFKTELNGEVTKPPTFGSLRWGQVYKQNYKIEIRPDKPEDKIYYWLREKGKDDYLLGPPSQNQIEKWTIYNEPIDISTKYGSMTGTSALAAFSAGNNGSISKITGPFYFKIDGDLSSDLQTFNESQKNTNTGKRIVTVNGNDLLSSSYIPCDSSAVLSFNSFQNDEFFYFIVENTQYTGKSDAFPASGSYTFTNESNIPAEIKVFYPTGEIIGVIYLNNKGLTLPVPKKYTSNVIEASSDLVLSFFMPSNIIRYEVSDDLYKNIEINEKSDIFTGEVKISANENEERSYKLKFASFDEDGNETNESENYFLYVDKKTPVDDVTSEGVDFTITHNDTEILKLIPPEKDIDIYYRLSSDKEWVKYDTQLVFTPPYWGLYQVVVYVKSIDKAGNEKENKDPFIIKFDKRGIFVDSSKKFNGNGTESAPYNSLERAIIFAKNKNMKLIYLCSSTYNIALPIKIESDIIIQPVNNNVRPSINMENKSLWKKDYSWFDVADNGYFELRNINYFIKSGNYFINTINAKNKLYNCEFNLYGKNQFTLINGNSSKIGLSNININTFDVKENISLIDLTKGIFIGDHININSNSAGSSFIKLNNVNESSLINLIVKNNCTQNAVFLTSINSNIVIKELNYDQTGDFKQTLLFDVTGGSLSIDKSDFIVKGKNPFETEYVTASGSKLKINDSFFTMDKSYSVIGFNLLGSTIDFSNSIVDINNVKDYIYTFRLESSEINLENSIIRNTNSSSIVSFLLNKSKFTGICNSIFSIDGTNKNIAFWVTTKADITTINNIYFYKNITGSKFIYKNSDDTDISNIVWYSNALNLNVEIMETLKSKTTENISNDFKDKNIYFDFTDNFNLTDKYFFLPLKDSLLLQSGLDDSKSPVKVPEKDFLGKNRLLSGFGIDIGAVQKSGYIED